MKILLTGANGQLGKELKNSVPKNIELIIKKKEEFNLLDLEFCKNKINEIKPDWIINAAAYTKVDMAEQEKKLAFAVNGYGPKLLAESIKNEKCKLIQISTDYVFDGKSKTPYKYSHSTNPINVYGKSKEFGEEAIQKILGKSNKGCILRTSWLMSHIGKNFVKTILSLHSSKKTIKVINDQFGSLTTTYSLAKACFIIINKFSSKNKKLPLKLHWSNSGSANWAQIAYQIGEIGIQKGLLTKKAEIIPISSKNFPQKARRPTYSVLDCEETRKILGYKPIHWEQALSEIIEKIKLNLYH